ncbi:hypothetical protein PV325_013012 [Microctonus aethiopoides]|nr:hypothetical protein PV325_013012 [Microctonus aethiopoides]
MRRGTRDKGDDTEQETTKDRGQQGTIRHKGQGTFNNSQNFVDIAFSGIWLTKDNYEFANLSISWHQLFIHFLVPRPKTKTSFWALTRPLSSEVWLAIIVTIPSRNLYPTLNLTIGIS